MKAVGPFEIDPDRRRVWCDGQLLPLRERAVEVLMALLERPGQVVAKRALGERAWPELEDAENNLQVEISALRRHLGPGLIVTVPGRGYQLALPAHSAPGLLGRDDDLAALQEALAGPGLVTLTGEGGIGKSTLAAAWAQAEPAVLQVQLDGVPDDEAEVCQALVAALRLPGGAALSAVATALPSAGRLWLDDADGAVAAVASVVDDLWRRQPGLVILVTSRETLGLPNERVQVLDGLPLESACALLRRELGPARVGAVGDARLAQLCRQVEAHPLALWWLVEQLCSADRARVVMQGGLVPDARFESGADRPRRHHRLCGSLADSASRLSPELRRVWRALVALPDPFTFDDLPPSLGTAWQRAEALAALVSRSLVRVQRADDPMLPPRHRLSALARCYLAGDSGS